MTSFKQPLETGKKSGKTVDFTRFSRGRVVENERFRESLSKVTKTEYNGNYIEPK
jgi:hypothetical protein